MSTNSDIRKAYRDGAAQAIDSMALLTPAPVGEMLREWLGELNAWTEGEPPLAPDLWE